MFIATIHDLKSEFFTFSNPDQEELKRLVTFARASEKQLRTFRQAKESKQALVIDFRQTFFITRFWGIIQDAIEIIRFVFTVATNKNRGLWAEYVQNKEKREAEKESSWQRSEKAAEIEQWNENLCSNLFFSSFLLFDVAILLILLFFRLSLFAILICERSISKVFKRLLETLRIFGPAYVGVM